MSTTTSDIAAVLTDEVLDKPRELSIVRWEGRIHCAYLNDFRIAGGKPWAGGTTEKEWNITLRDVIRAFPEIQQAVGLDYLGKLVASAAPSPWQPIETAPKDGTMLDLWIAGGRHTNAYWGQPQHTCGEAGRYCDCCPSYDAWVCADLNAYLTGDEGYAEDPTHWMPLPPAPSQIEEG